jgi:hypothetical protein
MLTLLAASAVAAAPMGLTVGALWTYNVRNTEEIQTGGPIPTQRSVTTNLEREMQAVSVDKTLFPESGPVFVLRQTDTEPGGDAEPEVQVLYVESTPSAIRELGFRNDGMEGRLVRLNPPDLSYKWPLKVGDQWTAEVGVDRLRIVAKSKVAGMEPVLVGAGKYSKAFRVETRSDELSGSVRVSAGRWARVLRGSIRQTYWVVADVGEVQWDDRTVIDLEVPVDEAPAVTVAYRAQDQPAGPSLRLRRTITEHGELQSYSSRGKKPSKGR